MDHVILMDDLKSVIVQYLIVYVSEVLIDVISLLFLFYPVYKGLGIKSYINQRRVCESTTDPQTPETPVHRPRWCMFAQNHAGSVGKMAEFAGSC